MTIVRWARTDVDLSKIEWALLAATTDVEIERQIAANPDTAPIFTTEELERARRVVPSDTVTRALTR